MLEAFAHLLTSSAFFVMAAGVLVGIAVGILPGITTGMMMALVLPFTYGMSSTDAVVLLIGIYVGGVSGGLVTATLMRMPGEPNAIMTCLDGYPLAKAGHPGRALGLGNAGSIVGGAISWVALVLIAQPLSRVAIVFGPWEQFALVCAALVMIVSLSGKSLLKGLIAAMLGMLLAMPGIDPSSGLQRLTFGAGWLTAGLDILPVMIGMFALSQIIADTLHLETNQAVIRSSMRGILISLHDYVRHGRNMLRSSLIGIGIGILPGVGASVSSIVAYTTAKKVSKEPEKFGKGSEEAIVAAESANNATTGGTLIPVLTLGIPGGLADAVLLSALILHNLQPGPMLYVRSPEIVNTILATHLVAHVMMFSLMTVGVLLFARLMTISRAWIFPAVLVICVVSTFALNNRPADIWVMLAFGVVGYALEYVKAPLAPLLIGFLLAPLAEAQLRTGLMASGGDFLAIFDRPIAVAFLLVGIAMLAWPPVAAAIRRHRQEQPLAGS
ncbi:tripartite tricarboxylate transporter permease [Aquamicrobium terrae]|uniref:Tricarboxylic transport membrane protein n=1 Tax=Aquamicrobium terrae TaxID=1324945 RepID=A0ABV2N7D5_9HYPH